MYKLATITLVTLFLVRNQVDGVVNNKGSHYKFDNEIQADDRISNIFPPPIYGPPELTGSTDVRIYPPPPPELPPPRIPKQPFYPPPPPPPPLKYKISSYRGKFSQYGPPAPPTPPDIKYDGWQPISGGDPTNLPNDSYGVPILSKEAQSLKQSVYQNEGLPPPPLPHYEPLYNQMPPKLEPLQSFAPPVGFEIYGPPLPPRPRPGSQFALFTQSYLKHGMHHRGPFRPPLPPLPTMIPPRNRDPLSFNDPIHQQLLPSYNTPLSFNNNFDCNDHHSAPENLDNSYLPPLGAEQLDLDSHEQSKSDLKDSYGNPIGVVTTNSNEEEDHLPLATNSLDLENNSPAALTADLTAQSYSTGRNNNDGFEIQGSKGSYTLQIQAADGGFGTENSDGSIRHEQLLTTGLIQEILAAIEQPNDPNNRIIDRQDIALYFNNTVLEETKT